MEHHERAHDLVRRVDLQAVAEALREELPSVVPEYGRGRERITARVAEILGTSAGTAKRVTSLLAERGLLHYNDGGRAIGVAGHWEIRRPEPT
jgi:hypothetical protein